MAQGYDGDIKLSVSLSADEVQQSAKSLQKEIQNIFSKTSGQNLDSSFQKLLSNMSKAASRSDALQKSLERVSNQKIATQEYANLEKILAQNERSLERLTERQYQLQQMGKENTAPYKKLEQEIKQVESNIRNAKAEMALLVEEGQAFTVNEESIERAKNALADSNNQMRMLVENAASYQNTMSQASQDSGQRTLSTWERIGNLFRQIGTDIAHPIQAIKRLRSNSENTISVFDRLQSGLSRIGTLARTVGGRVLQLASHFLKAHRASRSFGSGLNLSFKNILAYAIGIRGLFGLFSKLRSAISSAITDMAKLNGGMNQTNAAMSQLQSSLNLLKGSLAAAFTPILTVVAPILSNFIDQIASVISAIGMMIAKLTGAKSYFRAVKTSANFAGGGSGSSGKSAEEKYQEAVEKAQKKYDEQVAKTQEKNAKAAAKAEEQQAKAAKRLAEQQEKANRKLADFDDLNVLNIEDMEELEEIEADVYDMPELELPDKEDFLGGGGGASEPFGLEEVPIEDWEWNWDDLLAKAEELGRKLADFLNDIFKDEDLAKKIGNAIGNLLNMAIRFAYGFVDEFNFRQFGRWIGTLIQEAIETIDWGLLGETIGKGLNGLADSVIGFFETYQVGTLGASIAEMFNRAIREIDPELIGEAVADVLKAPLIELNTFLTSTNWTAAGEKFGTFFHEALTNLSLNGKTFGYTIGELLANAVNAGLKFLLSADISQAITDLTQFFYDMFKGAVDNLNWADIWQASIDILFGVAEAITVLIANAFIDLAEKLKLVSHEKAEAARTEGIADLRQVFEDAEAEVDGSKERMLASMADIYDYMADVLPSGCETWGEALQRVQEDHNLTDEQMQKLIQTMISQSEEFEEIAGSIEGNIEDWAEYRKTLEDTNPAIETAKQKQEELDEKIEDVGVTAIETADGVKQYVKLSADAMEEGIANVEEYEDKSVDALQGISDKSDEVVISFDTLTEQLNAELTGLTTAIDTWYQEMITIYFGYDAWLLLLQEGPLLALTDFFNIDFITFWDTQMEMWWNEHLLIWFSDEKWNTDVFTPWKTNLVNKWRDLMTWWDTMMTSWWNNKVVPWFKEKKWEDEFMHVYKVAEKVGEKTKNRVSELADETAEAVHSACEAMKMWIQEVLEKLGEAIEMANELKTIAGSGGGGSSSSGGSHGGSSGSFSGGSRTHNFMPMLDIMHFEDNLGMSAFRFPELATGAVIPPNNEFLAVLGDQRNGMNIETPLATMVEAFRSVMDEYMSGSHQSATMEVDGETFARLMMPHIMDEMNRLGYNTEIIEGI